MDERKPFVIGVSRRKGVGKQSRKPYDMCILLVGKPIVADETADFRIYGLGYQVDKGCEIQCQPEALDRFMESGARLPCFCDLGMDVVTDERGRTGPMVTEIRAARPVSAAPSSKAAAG